MINNFKQVRELLQFNEKDDFYFIELMKLRKDNPKLSLEYKPIKEYYVYSLQDFDNVKDEILTICEMNRSRAYIRMNKRNSSDSLLYAMKILVTAIENREKMNGSLCRKTASSAHNDPDPKFTVNTNNHNDYEFAKSVIQGIWQDDGDPTGKILAEVKMPNGIHLITKPFDIDKFRMSCPNIHVSRDGRVLLYCPIIPNPGE